MLGWACVIGILGLSASISCNSEFFYSRNIFRRTDQCSLCIKKDCLVLEKARCDYYAEADSLLPKDVEEPEGIENAAKRREVDDLIFNLVEKGLSSNMECIPYVSRYTDCNKDNVCLGCKTCACSSEGRWNCTTMHPCYSQDPPLNIDHRILVIIMEALTDSAHPKKAKRSVTTDLKDTTTPISLQQLSEWLYGVKPLHMQETGPTDVITDDATMPNDEPASEIAATVTDTTISGLTITEETETTTIEDADYIAFDEVLRSIAVDPKTYNRRKPLNDTFHNNHTYSLDYMIMDEGNETSRASNNHVMSVVNLLDYDNIMTETPATGSTKVVVDLLETPGTTDTSVNKTEGFTFLDDTNYNKDEDQSILENMNDIMQYNPLNIMKRDVAGQENITVSQSNITAPNVVPTVTLIINTTNTTNNNVTAETADLKEHVLIPLNNIIYDKVKELENLQKIKEDLLKYVKTDSLPENIAKDNSTASNTYFSIYNVAMAPGIDIDPRRANQPTSNRYEKYMIKLKSDIFNVIRDILAIQKYKISDLPDELKHLMRAMKRYVYKNDLVKKPKRIKTRKHKGFRRNMGQNNRCERLSFKDCLVQIIEVIDKDIPKSNALSPLSPASRRIMNNVIKSYYVDQLIMPGLRTRDHHYNLTIYLNSIGSKWHEQTANLISSAPFASLHRIKLLHCTLTMDISKINDAIGLIEFTHSRRMAFSEDQVGDDTLDRINEGLSAIHNKILMLIQYYKRTPTTPETDQPRSDIKDTKSKLRSFTPTKDPAEVRKDKKRSFIKHIRSLLKTSKNDIAELLHRKVPKAEIVRQLAKKRLDEITEKRYNEYEETMKRWQKNLEISARMKRSVLDQYKTRIKNIIPKYLRHKVNPRIKQNQKNATADATRKADFRKKKRKARKASRRGRKARNSTTKESKKLTSTKTKKPTTLSMTLAPTTRGTATTSTITLNTQ